MGPRETHHRRQLAITLAAIQFDRRIHCTSFVRAAADRRKIATLDREPRLRKQYPSMSTSTQEKTGPSATVHLKRPQALPRGAQARRHRRHCAPKTFRSAIPTRFTSFTLTATRGRCDARRADRCSDGARRDARVSRAEGAASHRCPGPAHVRRMRRPLVHRRAVLPDGVHARRRRSRRQQAFRANARAAPPGQRADGRRADRDAGSRLARRRPRGFRPSRRLPRTPAQAMDRSARAHAPAHAPAAGDGKRQGMAARANSRVAPRRRSFTATTNSTT